MSCLAPRQLFPGWIQIPHLLPILLAAAALTAAAAGLFFFLYVRKKKTAAVRKDAPVSEDPSIRKILQSITEAGGLSGGILLAAGSINDLPVTVPLNIAAALSESGTCLLIDLDSKRNPMARVFDIDSSAINVNLKVSPVATGLPNVDVWPAEYFDLLKQMNLRELLETARKKYDFILLYAPYLTTLADRRQIASCVSGAVLFGNEGAGLLDCETLLKKHKCRILLKTTLSP